MLIGLQIGELGLAQKEDIRILTLTSEEYPELLQSIYDPPPVLYVKGKPLNSISFPLAVVGTCNPSEYGKIIAHRLCLKLASADFALEQGREVFAVPGNITSPKSKGTNDLIKAGAKLVDSPESLIEELLPALRERMDKPEIKLDNDNERQVFSLLSLEGLHIDHLIGNSDLSPAQVSATLLQLELRGLVRQLSVKIYVSNCDTK